MNQWGPGWDVHPQYICPDPMCREPGVCMRKTNERGFHVAPIGRPDDYRAETNGPYTSPTEPTAASKPPRYGWGTFITLAVLGVLFVIGMAVSASRDDEVVQIPNTVLHPTPTPTPTPTHFTPQAHKPGPPATGVTEYMPDDGGYLVGVQIQPGTYSAVCAVELCSWVRAEYIPELGVEIGVVDSYSSTPPRDRLVVGDTVIVKILPTDSTFITQGFTSWVRS